MINEVYCNSVDDDILEAVLKYVRVDDKTEEVDAMDAANKDGSVETELENSEAEVKETLE